jgi:hypothetical protein
MLSATDNCVDNKQIADKIIRLLDNWDEEGQAGDRTLAIVALLEQRTDKYQETLVRIREHLQAQDYETHRCWFALEVAKEALGETK